MKQWVTAIVLACLLPLLGTAACRKNSPTLTTQKAVTQQLEAIPETYRPFLPHRGIVFLSMNFDPPCSFIVDLDTKKLRHHACDPVHQPDIPEGERKLSGNELKRIVQGINQIWSNPKGFEPEFYPARVMLMTVILADQGAYRSFYIGGPLVAEMAALYDYLLNLAAGTSP